LKLAQRNGDNLAFVYPNHVYENHIQQISFSIKNRYWDALTRRIDAKHLPKILKDSKMNSASLANYIYVPYNDDIAYNHFINASFQHPELKITVKKLPKDITPQYLRSIEAEHGLLSLAFEQTSNGKYVGIPFVVPGGRFNEMYGWDCYFESLGLLVDDRIDLAKAMIDNFVYEIEHYGRILNANRTYYLTRSQPPFLTSLCLAVYEKLPKTTESKKWLKSVILTAIKEYNTIWMNKDHLTWTGLSRYYGGNYLGQPKEVEVGHYDVIYARYAQKYKMDPKEFENAYFDGSINVPELDTFFLHDRSLRESGYDTTYRFGDDCRCADFVTVDLNSLLYKTEIDIARILAKEFNGTLITKNGLEEKSST